uniref:Uncharacterized protein n=1 Tax=Trypanosoma vivax (strain Y486) TaxID=1055687 RepID=G0TWK8_TRYVY|nr:hypothetical protein TVY486_0601370 [Trypanosoma vivax Y486]
MPVFVVSTCSVSATQNSFYHSQLPEETGAFVMVDRGLSMVRCQCYRRWNWTRGELVNGSAIHYAMLLLSSSLMSPFSPAHLHYRLPFRVPSLDIYIYLSIIIIFYVIVHGVRHHIICCAPALMQVSYVSFSFLSPYPSWWTDDQVQFLYIRTTTVPTPLQRSEAQRAQASRQ